jgi:hypothetical protein
MANLTGTWGLRPLRHLNGSPWNGALVRAYCSASYATALYVGDPVVWDTAAGDKDATAKFPTIIKSAGTAGILVRGVIVGFEPDPTNLELKYRPASTERWALICCDPDCVYEIRGDGGAALTDVLVGQNAVMIADSAGSTVTGLSGMALDEGTTTAPGDTQNYTLHILGIKNVEDNELAASAAYEVLLNTCENATGRFAGITAT